MTPSETGTCAVLDFGSQTTQLIARRVREAGVYCEILPWDAAVVEIIRLNPGALILSGGPSSVFEEGAPALPDHVLAMRLPVLGICYGMQAIAARLGGEVRLAESREYGRALCTVDPASPLFAGLDPSTPEEVWMSHGDEVVTPPPGFRVTARSASGRIAAMSDEGRRIQAVQFHPEVSHTRNGGRILTNFLFGIAGLQPGWDLAQFLEKTNARVRETVGDGRVLVAMSGGVDSSVTAALLRRALPGRVTAVLVDNGLLRDGERERVEAAFPRGEDIDLRVVDAGAAFLADLEGVSDPEEKRRRIGARFIRVFEEEVARLPRPVEFLAQGTLYPDVIESRSVRGPSHVIKTHHNVGGLPETMRLRLVEPLRDLFKDEVRRLGTLLGLPESLVFRQPFPGPGLAVRCIGDVTAERLAVLRAADAILDEEMRGLPDYRGIWQSFAVLLPLRTVGVMGDRRTFGNVVALRAVTSVDAMTADCCEIPFPVLKRIATRIVNEVEGVNRVVYDLTSKPPATIEWE